jgi:hypothetical protein
LKSDKRYKNSQQRKSPVFFLDRNLGAEKLAGILRPAGFALVTHHDKYGAQRTRVSDPEIIADCGLSRWVLLTADRDLEFTYAAEITTAKIAVFILSNNHEGPSKWGPRVVTAKPRIETELGRRRKPFAAHITAEGHINQVRLYYKKKTKVIRIAKKSKKQVAAAA